MKQAECREILNYLCAEQQGNKKYNKASDDNLKQNRLQNLNCDATFILSLCFVMGKRDGM
jgi:hypothetical protein